ncbi:MAG TPA: (2Fe-2S)-binding protein [Acidimicrobiaceae bacterium]|nr:(2Fe-2S)-binding protein [Acidimicrobiaceae bacterium]
MVVCHCLAVNDSTIRELLDSGALSVEEIGTRCGAGTECGSCVEQVRRLAVPQTFAIRSAVA